MKRSPDSVRHHSVRLSSRKNKPEEARTYRDTESASPQVHYPSFAHRIDSSRKHMRKKIMSNLPLRESGHLRSVPAEGLSERGNRLTSVPEEDSKFRGSRIKQINPKSNNRSACYNLNPSENVSVGSLSCLSKSRLLTTSKALKKVNTQITGVVQASDLSASHLLNRTTAKKSNSGTLEITSQLLNKIRNKQSDRAIEQPLNLVEQAAPFKPQERGERGKYLNIALSSAKNINMFEINNYFSSPLEKELSGRETVPAGRGKLALSKQYTSNTSELSKQKPISKTTTGKNQGKQSARQIAASKETLQAKLSAIATTWRNRQSSSDQ